MSWDVIARALFVDNGAAAGLAKFNSQIHEITKAAPGGARGLRTFETGLQTLALEAVGVQGPVGKLAEGLLRFGGGSTLILGAAAGIGLIAGAYKLAAAEAEHLKENNEKLAQSWRDVAAQGKPLVALGNQLQAAITKETAAQAEFNKLSQTAMGKTRGSPGEIALAETGLSQAQHDVAQIRGLFHAEQNRLISEANQRGQKWAQAFLKGVENLDLVSQLRTLALGGTAYNQQFGAMGRETGKLWAEAWLKAAEGMLDRGLDIQGHRLGTGLGSGLLTGKGGPKLEGALSPGFKPEKFPPREYFISDLEKSGGKAQPTRPDPARLAAEAVALLGALQQGGVAGILGAAGGLASTASGLKGLGGLGPVGIGLSVASGIFGMFDHSAERRHREQMAELTRIRENTTKRGEPGRQSFTFILNGKEISGAILQDVIYGYGRAARTNNLPVLPP